MQLSKRHFLRACFLVVAAVFLTVGCANYRMGDTAALPFKSVYVAPVENASVAPQAQAPISNQVRTSLLNAGLSLEPRGAADAVLSITITDYSRVIATTQTSDTMIASAYDLTITVKATLTSADGNTVYFKDLPISSTLQIFYQQGYTQSEYQIMPLLARELGRKISDAVTTLW